MQTSPAMRIASVAIDLASIRVCAISARAADRAYMPPEPIAMIPSSGSITSPVPLMTSEVSRSATASSASSFPRRRSVRQSLAISTAARTSWPCFSSLASNSSNRVKASAAAPAKPAITWPSRPSRRILRALAFMTVLPSVTWPSPATATRPSRRTETMVVAWNTLGLWLGSMGGLRGRTPCLGATADGGKGRRIGDRPLRLLPLRPGVRPVIDPREVLVVQVRVDLRGGDVGMAEQLLDAPQVARGLQDVAGEAVPQQVRVDALEQALLPRQLADPQLHRARRDRAIAAGEHRVAGTGSGRPGPFRQGGPRMRADRHGPLPLALAHDGDQPIGQVEVAPAQ